MYIGFCVGPILGSFSFNWTQLLLFPHLCKVVFYFLFFFVVVFVMPESLSETQQCEERRVAKELERRRLMEEEDWRAQGRRLITLRLKRIVTAPLEILKPLKILLPLPSTHCSTSLRKSLRSRDRLVPRVHLHAGGHLGRV